MNLLSRFLPRVEFDSYEDFKKNYKVEVPEGFNFAYDVVDEYARLCPEKQALIHIDENEKITRYTFADIKRLSDKSANVLRSYGIGKGDSVMMMMKEREGQKCAFLSPHLLSHGCQTWRGEVENGGAI